MDRPTNKKQNAVKEIIRATPHKEAADKIYLKVVLEGEDAALFKSLAEKKGIGHNTLARMLVKIAIEENK